MAEEKKSFSRSFENTQAKEETYIPVYQNNCINSLMEIGSKSIIQRDRQNHSYIKKDEVGIIWDPLENIVFNDKSALGLNEKKFLWYFNAIFTKQIRYKIWEEVKKGKVSEKDAIYIIEKARNITFEVDEAIEILGRGNRKDAIELMKTSLYKLAYSKAFFKTEAIKKTKKPELNYLAGKILNIINIDGQVKEWKTTVIENGEKKTISGKKWQPDIRDGKINIVLDIDYAKLLTFCQIAYYPLELKTTKDPIAFYLGYKMATGYQIKIANKNKNVNYWSVRTLIENSEEFPSIDKAIKTKHFNRIIESFCNALEELPSFDFVFYTKIDGKRAKVTYSEKPGNKYLNTFKGYKADAFLDLTFYCYMKDNPVTKKLEKKQNKAE